MSTREESLKRLREERWTMSGGFRKGLVASGAKVQSLADGSGDCVCDEYAFDVSSMPPDTSPQDFVQEMAMDLNGTVDDSGFNFVNIFRRSAKGIPKVGEIVYIDIAGPDNGCVILAELAPDYFIFQTVETNSAGTHSENGSREFGIEQTGATTKIYTRGVSRPGNALIRFAGSVPQMVGWTRLCKGLSDTVAARGDQPIDRSFVCFKQNRKF